MFVRGSLDCLIRSVAFSILIFRIYSPSVQRKYFGKHFEIVTGCTPASLDSSSRVIFSFHRSFIMAVSVFVHCGGHAPGSSAGVRDRNESNKVWIAVVDSSSLDWHSQ